MIRFEFEDDDALSGGEMIHGGVSDEALRAFDAVLGTLGQELVVTDMGCGMVYIHADARQE